MRLLGFDFTEISGEKKGPIKKDYSTNTNVDISEVVEEKTEFLKDLEVIKVSFNFLVEYLSKEKKESNLGKVSLKGHLIFSAGEQEAKDLLKSWKNNKDEKKIHPQFRIPLFNLIIRKCTPKAIDLEDSLGLPFHIPFPQVKAKDKN